MDELYERLKNEIKVDVLKKLNVLEEVYTVKEAAELWNIHPSTITKLITTTSKLIKNVDYKKSGATWLITKYAMIKVYGQLKEE